MRYWYYRARRYFEEHQPEIAFGVMTFSISMVIKSEIQWKKSRKDIYVHATPAELSALVRNEVSTVSYDVGNNFHIHLMKVNPSNPIERTLP